MPEADLLAIFVEPLERFGFRYMVTGSVAAMLYGEPRLTNDVDIVLGLDPADAPKLRQAFASDDFYCPPEDEIRIESARPSRGHVNATLRTLLGREGLLDVWREVSGEK